MSIITKDDIRKMQIALDDARRKFNEQQLKAKAPHSRREFNALMESYALTRRYVKARAWRTELGMQYALHYRRCVAKTMMDAARFITDNTNKTWSRSSSTTMQKFIRSAIIKKMCVDSRQHAQIEGILMTIGSVLGQDSERVYVSQVNVMLLSDVVRFKISRDFCSSNTIELELSVADFLDGLFPLLFPYDEYSE